MDVKDTSSPRSQIQKSSSAEMVPVHQKQVAVSPKRDVVKSMAVVKWSETQFPVQFSKLSMNTNLNDAPANWLHSESREEQHLRDLPWQRQHSDCSSFAMAFCFPDYAGEVDVVSDAENIKRLLKIPYDTSHTSLMVHRVGRTLLLDNFDIHKHLLRQESENWTWLREFFKDTVVKNDNELKNVPRRVKTQAALQDQLMYSKFLYKSLSYTVDSGQEVEVPQVDRRRHVSPSSSPSPVMRHCVADRLPALDSAHFGVESGFHRQMLWTFEDLRMLIGTDLPVFSVGDHPCVSVRLRDSAQPVNVVTGLDYWLDNLMCNVPEVAMCYHHSGVVQKYELIKTEDIPKLTNSAFKPHEVKDIASNILSFLRDSATKEGHTYWLYKCHRSDVVKLYDLTDLCDSSVPNQGVTPFTIPVAMLLYRVGRRMHLNGKLPHQLPQIKTLLQTSLQLLDETEHAEVCTSSYYLLSDLYIPDSCLQNVWVDDPPHDTSSEQSSEEEEEGDEESRSEFSVSVKDLMQAPRGNLHPVRRTRLEGITGTPDERCKDGLQCIRKGLSCLERDLQAKILETQRSNSSIVEEQRTCNSSEAIPLRYEPLKQAQQSNSSKVLVQRSAVRAESSPDTWHKLSKALMMRKACMANYILATEFLSNKQFGTALKHVRYAIHCFEAMAQLKPSKKTENSSMLMMVLLTTSEVRHHLAVSGGFEEHLRGYDDMSEEDAFILDSAQSTLSVPELAWVYKWTANRVENLQTALRCLDTIRELARHQSQTAAVRDLIQDVTKKTSAICNELGKAYMSQAECLMTSVAAFDDMESVWTKSMGTFDRGLEGFRKVKDKKNEVVVLMNMTRLHKIAAQVHITSMAQTTKQFCGPARHHFEEAFECYQKALQCLDHGHRLRNNILWEFSSTYLTVGVYLQEYPPGSVSDSAKIHQEAAEMYRKAMKKCQQIVVDSGEDLWYDCKNRLATLEYNLAELHISSYQHQATQGRCNKVFSQAESSFKRAIDLFKLAGKNYKILQLQCKRLAFHICHYNAAEENPQMLLPMLKLVIDCECYLQSLLKSGFPEDNDKERLSTQCREPIHLLDYLLKPVSIILRHQLMKAKQQKKNEQQVKDLYKRTLELHSQVDSVDLSLETKYQLMIQLVASMRQYYNTSSS